MKTAAPTNSPALTPAATPAAGRLLQRKCACGTHTGGGECDSCGKTRLQRKATNHPDPPEVPEVVHDVLNSPGRPLDAATRSFMEPRFGHDFSHVRIHADALASESARAVNALAYTVGSHIAVRGDRHEPETAAGRRLIAHELAHVVQQSGGGGGVGGDPESRADAAAQRVMAGQEVSPAVVGAAPAGLYRQHDEEGAEEDDTLGDDDDLLRLVRGYFGSAQRRNPAPAPSFPDMPWHPQLTPLLPPPEGKYFSMVQTQEYTPQVNLRLPSTPSAGKGLPAGYNQYDPDVEKKMYTQQYLEKMNKSGGKNPTGIDMVRGQVMGGVTKTVMSKLATTDLAEEGKKRGLSTLKHLKHQLPRQGIRDAHDPGPGIVERVNDAGSGILERLKDRLCGGKKKKEAPKEAPRVGP